MFFDDFFGWDREFYNFERSIRDSAPYKIYRDEKEVTIIHNVLGIDEKDRFCPSWLKKADETHVNVHSIFDIPIQNEKGFTMDMLDLFEGAEVSMIINVKEGAIYPAVIKVHKNGTPSNPFADFDECEEV